MSLTRVASTPATGEKQKMFSNLRRVQMEQPYPSLRQKAAQAAAWARLMIKALLPCSDTPSLGQAPCVLYEF
jgi:hypothetical protein